MKKITLISLITFIQFNLFSKEVPLNEAMQVAQTKVQDVHQLSSRNSISLQLAYSENFTNAVNEIQPAFYIFNTTQNNGFVIVAGDDKITPILGYTDHGNFDVTNIPTGLKKLFFEFKKGITQIANDQAITSPTVLSAEWTNLKNGVIVSTRMSGVGPLTTTEWSQRPNYNVYCPDNSPTGCVATAVSQIMKYYNHPQQGKGYHSYNHNDYGTLKANFGATTYNWNNMPNKLYAISDSTEKKAISLLMYHVGVALNMNYSPNGSGASSSDVPRALVNYFKYDAGISMKSRTSYSLTGWKNLLKNELNAGRLVYHRGYCPDPSAGHAFVIDGYDVNDLFHVNWGWSGSYNGYFQINNLNPGSTYTWNDGQGAIVGIKPDTSSQVDLKLFSNIAVNPVTINFNQPFSVTVDIANYGNTTFTGKLKASIFDSLDNFLGDVQVKTGVSITSSNYNTYTFNSTGMNITPGNYSIGIYVDLGNNSWSLIDEDAFTNPIQVQVSSINNLGLISNGNILVNPDPIKQNQSFQVEFDVINSSTTPFSGQISIDIHELNGDWIDEVGSLTTTIGANATKNIVLNHAGLALDPGSYSIVIWHKPSGGSWEIIEEGSYPNSRQVDITGLDFFDNAPDQYEVNDTITMAYPFALNYSNNFANIQTSGASIHQVGDKDYYSVHLDAGYDYLVYARVYDNYSNGATGNYSNDMMFTYYNGNTTGTYYDDAEMPTTLVNNIPPSGTDFIFELVPFYFENIGTYMFEIEVIRQAQTTSLENINGAELKLYPNPTRNVVNVDQVGYNTLKIISLDGSLVKETQLVNKLEVIQVNELPAGIYLFNLIGKDKVTTKRIEIIK